MCVSQTSVGWKNLFRGHISVSLQEYYEQHSVRATQNWTYRLLNILWTHSRDLWNMRNSQAIGVTSGQRRHAVYRKLVQELKLLYDKKQYMHSSDRHHFYDTPEQNLEHHKSPTQVCSWMKLVRKTVVSSIHSSKIATRKGVLPLSKYFPARFHSRPTVKRVKSHLSRRRNFKRQTYLSFHPRTSLLQFTPNLDQRKFTLTPRELQPK